jgi:hypothetical protein
MRINWSTQDTVKIEVTDSNGRKSEFNVHKDPEKASRLAKYQESLGNDVKVTDGNTGDTPWWR